LCAGDVLYIPRGWPHQATAIDDEGLASEERREGPSVHLTLAVEVEPPFDWEGALHHALRGWAEAHAPHGRRSDGGDMEAGGEEAEEAEEESQGGLRGHAKRRRTAAEGVGCGFGGTEVWWAAEALLHVALAAAAGGRPLLRAACLASGGAAEQVGGTGPRGEEHCECRAEDTRGADDAAAEHGGPPGSARKHRGRDASMFAALLAELAEVAGQAAKVEATVGEMQFSVAAAAVRQQLHSDTPPWERLAWLGLVGRGSWVGWDSFASLDVFEARLRGAVASSPSDAVHASLPGECEVRS
jgi:hypothetical protein